MAITNARILIRRGLEADFNPDGLQPGEWALSVDRGKEILRVCVSPGVCIRMATYEAFEEDMVKIEEILEECQSIQEAVIRINTEVSQNADAVAEYTAQAKQYRDEAKQFRDEAFATTPDGYEEIVENVAKNTVKIDTIIEKAELNIKNNAKGDNLHLTDSANGKNIAFGLYGKATQESTTGKNKLKNTATSRTVNGITFTVNEDGSITANGTNSGTQSVFAISSNLLIPKGDYIFTSGLKTNNSLTTGGTLQWLRGSSYYNDTQHSKQVFDEDETVTIYCVVAKDAVVNNLTFYPMIYLSTETDATYEPYTNGPSPNPDYPQEIEVSGASGSVEVKSVGKNLWTGDTLQLYLNTETGVPGVSASAQSPYIKCIENVTYTIQKKAGTRFTVATYEKLPESGMACIDVKTASNASSITITPSKGAKYLMAWIWNEATDTDITLEEMLATFQIEYGDTATSYESPKGTIATIPTPNGLSGIPVSSGGNYTDENGQQWICDSIVKYADGTGKKIQRIGKSVFDGSESWTLDAETNFNENTFTAYCSKLPPIAFYGRWVSIPSLCNRLVKSGTSVWDNKITNECFMVCKYSEESANEAGQITIRLNKDRVSTISSSAVKAFFASNPMTVYYELAEPIITDLSAEEIAEIEKLQTFYPVTNISNDADCGMEIAYKADAKNYIDNIILDRVATLETAIINNL